MEQHTHHIEDNRFDMLLNQRESYALEEQETILLGPGANTRRMGASNTTFQGKWLVKSSCIFHLDIQRVAEIEQSAVRPAPNQMITVAWRKIQMIH